MSRVPVPALIHVGPDLAVADVGGFPPTSVGSRGIQQVAGHNDFATAEVEVKHLEITLVL
jgi:hypothetical protein